MWSFLTRASTTTRQIAPKFRRHFSTAQAPVQTTTTAATEAAAATTTTAAEATAPVSQTIGSSRAITSECRGKQLIECYTKKAKENGGKNPFFVALCWGGLGFAYIFVNTSPSSATDCIREYKYKFLTQRRGAQAVAAQSLSNQRGGKNQAEAEFFAKRNIELEKLRAQKYDH